MTRIWGVVLGLLGLAGTAAGCGGSGSSGPLDCAWLAGDNCWKQRAAAASTCLPPASETGTLSADNKTCSYASGATITFAAPLTLPIVKVANQAPSWNFTVANGGADCLHFQSSDQGMKLVAGGQTVSEGRSGPTGLAVTCPDGTTYANSNALNLFTCGGDGGVLFGGLPGFSYASTSTDVRFGLVGTEQSVPVFDCEK